MSPDQQPTVSYSVDELTLMETADIEEALDQTLDAALVGVKRARALGMVALAHRRRTDPDATLEAVMGSITLGSFEPGERPT